MRMRWNHTIVGAAVVLMALAGCAGEDNDQPSDPAPGAPTSAPADPNPSDSEAGHGSPGTGEAGDDASAAPKPGAGTPVAKEQIDASALPKSYPREASTEDRRLTITAQESGCGKASAELRNQTDTRVVVLLVHTVPKGDVMCTMDIRFPRLTVELDEPLGERTLVLEGEERKK